jgi:hypothetical protein
MSYTFWINIGSFEYQINGKKLNYFDSKDKDICCKIWELLYLEDSPKRKEMIIQTNERERKVIYSMSIKDFLKMSSDKENQRKFNGTSKLQLYDRLYRLSEGNMDGNITVTRFDRKCLGLPE